MSWEREVVFVGRTAAGEEIILFRYTKPDLQYRSRPSRMVQLEGPRDKVEYRIQDSADNMIILGESAKVLLRWDDEFSRCHVTITSSKWSGEATGGRKELLERRELEKRYRRR